MARAKTILIIDDDSDLREALREQLELTEEFAAEDAATPPRASGSPRNCAPT